MHWWPASHLATWSNESGRNPRSARFTTCQDVAVELRRSPPAPSSYARPAARFLDQVGTEQEGVVGPATSLRRVQEAARGLGVRFPIVHRGTPPDVFASRGNSPRCTLEVTAPRRLRRRPGYSLRPTRRALAAPSHRRRKARRRSVPPSAQRVEHRAVSSLRCRYRVPPGCRRRSRRRSVDRAFARIRGLGARGVVLGQSGDAVEHSLPGSS